MNDGDIGTQETRFSNRSGVMTVFVNGRKNLRVSFFDLISAFDIHSVDDDVIGIFGKRRGKSLRIARVTSRFACRLSKARGGGCRTAVKY